MKNEGRNEMMETKTLFAKIPSNRRVAYEVRVVDHPELGPSTFVGRVERTDGGRWYAMLPNTMSCGHFRTRDYAARQLVDVAEANVRREAAAAAEPTVTSAPPRWTPRTCNACVEKPAVVELTFGRASTGGQMAVALCDDCTTATKWAIVDRTAARTTV